MQSYGKKLNITSFKTCTFSFLIMLLNIPDSKNWILLTSIWNCFDCCSAWQGDFLALNLSCKFFAARDLPPRISRTEGASPWGPRRFCCRRCLLKSCPSSPLIPLVLPINSGPVFSSDCCPVCLAIQRRRPLQGTRMIQNKEMYYGNRDKEQEQYKTKRRIMVTGTLQSIRAKGHR